MENATQYVLNFIDSLGIFGPIISCLIIVIESIFPILPLCVFISLNFIVFGQIFGLLISFVCTMLGCCFSFFLCRYAFRDFFENKFRKNVKVNKLMTYMDDIKLKTLVLITAIPFTPAFFINIAAGLSKCTFKKYLYSLLIGKFFMVAFWGFVGSTLVESLKNPIKLVYTAVLVAIAYFISVFVSKKLNID